MALRRSAFIAVLAVAAAAVLAASATIAGFAPSPRPASSPATNTSHPLRSAALASSAAHLRSDASVLDTQADHVIDTLYTLGCTQEAEQLQNAADATHQIQTCRVTTRDPANRPILPTDPAPADWLPEVTIIRQVVSRLGRQRWRPPTASRVSALRRAATLLAGELSAPGAGGAGGAGSAGSAGGEGGRSEWSTTVLEQIGHVKSLASAAVTGSVSGRSVRAGRRATRARAARPGSSAGPLPPR